MGFKKRMKVILRSRLNDWLTRAEDPAKILAGAVEEMDEGLERARVRLAGLRSGVEERSKLLKRTKDMAVYWQERSVEYVRQGMDENAAEAVRRRRLTDEKVRRLSAVQAEEEEALTEYETQYESLAERVRAAREKKTVLLCELSPGGGGPAETPESSSPESPLEEPFYVFRRIEERLSGEPVSLETVRDKDAREREERLIAEEVESIKKNIQKGGSKK
ncbi:MAG TPA: PspA/IM30 family protein [Thermodesulfobacteriota bacterium]|nr:PspA/IM30 family protein [Thermodesulfobacteriota bacterium]